MRSRFKFLDIGSKFKGKYFFKQPTLLIELESVLSEEEDSDRMRGD